MDSFESIVKTIFENEGYWVKTSFKVNLTKEEKRTINRPSSPRWEIDLIAYKGNHHELLVIECKSFLNSSGVHASGISGGKSEERYKLFNDKILREVVFSRLHTQLVESGLCPEDTKLTLCLAAGKVASKKDRDEITKYFNRQGWNFYSDDWIRNRLKSLSGLGYENDIAIVATKILNDE